MHRAPASRDLIGTHQRVLAAWQAAALRLTCLIAALALPAAALAQASLRDDRGHSVQFERAPQRIVSLLPSLTESVCALQACDRLVGVDRYSNWPSAVDKLPRLGGLDDAQVERIVALRPDVVLAARSARVTERLEALGIRVIALESQSHADVRRTLGLLATMLGTPARGDALWAEIERDLQAAAARVPAAQRGRKVYFEIASAPYAAGASSFIGETLSRLGLGNIVPSELGPFPKLNPEHVVRLQPDLVMAAQREVSAMPARPGWHALRALAQRQHCGFDAESYEMLIRPGPRLGRSAQLLADCLARLPSP
jgi:iron complex transport system substrate-binding protein